MIKAGYAGRMVAVNPRRTSIYGVRCVPRVEDLDPGEAEVALLAIPASQVSSTLASLSSRGTLAAVSIASGFERAQDGPALRETLAEVLAASQTRLVGPNCVGVMSPSSGTHLNFSSVLQSGDVRDGGVALITQSGALGNGILQSILRRGAGLRVWVSTGDEIDVGALEVLTGILADDGVKAVGLFLEALTDLDWLDRCAAAIGASGKHVFALKAARTEAGRHAASGHTGRIVGAADISRAVLRRLGVVEVETLGELADALVGADILSRPRGRSLTIVSVSGGSGVIAADRARVVGLDLARLDGPEASERIWSVLPNASAENPLDVPVLGKTHVFSSAIVTLADPALTDAVVAVESSLAHDREELVGQLVQASEGGRLAPLVLTHLTEDDPIPESLVQTLARAGIAVAPSPERAVSLIERLVVEAAPGDAAEAAERPAVIGFSDALDALGGTIPHPTTIEVGSFEEARAAAESIGYPVVLKAAGRTVAHRTELGLVRTDVTDAVLSSAYDELAAAVAAHGDGLIVQTQVPSGFEVLVSVLNDPEFGWVAIVRAGGVLTELLNEQVMLPALWTRAARADELGSSRLGHLLEGYRGTVPYDTAGLLDLVEAVLDRVPDTKLASVEFNPVIVHRSGVMVVDAVAGPSDAGDQQQRKAERSAT